MEITVPRIFAHYSDDDASSSSGAPSPLSLPLTDARVTSTDPLPEWQCKYTGRICPHRRARKTNGKLHRLCEEHRVRANVNQRRLQQKRREARAEMRAPYPLSPAGARALDGIDTVEVPASEDWEEWVVELLKENEQLEHDEKEPLAMAAVATMTAEPLSSPCQLTDEDVEELTLLFTSSISTDSTENELYDVMCDAVGHSANS